MEVIIGIFVAFIIIVGLLSWLHNKYAQKTKESSNEIDIPIDCCGAHDVCEVEAMIQNPNEILYFEDEELDRFRGTVPSSYSEENIEEFRDVLYTLKDDDEIRMWLISIERRGVALPDILKQEAIQMLN